MDRDSVKRRMGAIRSLSAPTVQVRKNRTSYLRDIFSVHNSDLSNLTKPPMAETNSSVAGMNKSAAMSSQKQISLWFRDRSYMVDKLQRYEDEVYDRLCIIEKTKWRIEKTREGTTSRIRTSPPSRVGTNIQSSTLPIIDQQNTSMTAVATENKTVENVEQENDKTEENKNGETIIDITKGGKVVQHQNVARPLTQPNDTTLTSPTPVMAPRADTNVDGMLTSVRGRPPTPRRIRNSKASFDPSNVPAPKEDAVFNEAVINTVQSENRLVQSENYKGTNTPCLDTTRSLSKAKEIENRILNEPFTYWKKTVDGKFVKAEVTYKRREFPLPVERQDGERLRTMMDKERRSKRDHVKKYRILCESLATLEKYNPLDEARMIKKMEEEAKNNEFDAHEKWKKLGMLRHWVRAIQNREARDLQGLDPNSEEALRQCKYLRLKEKTEIRLTPAQEKQQAKKNWIANLQNRLTNVGDKNKGGGGEKGGAAIVGGDRSGNAQNSIVNSAKKVRQRKISTVKT